MAIVESVLVGLLTNAVYDYLKSNLTADQPQDINAIEDGLGHILKIQGAEISSAQAVQLLADHGYLSVSGTKVTAGKRLLIASESGSGFDLRGGTDLHGPGGSHVGIGSGASASSQGAGSIELDEKGNVIITAGKPASKS